MAVRSILHPGIHRPARGLARPASRGINRNSPQADGLWARWPVTLASGNDLIDRTGGGRTSTWQGSVVVPWFFDHQFGHCIDLDAVSTNYFRSVVFPFGTADFAISLWFQSDDFNTADNFVSQKDGSTPFLGWRFRQQTSTERVQFEVDWGASSQGVNSNSLTATDWHHTLANIDRSDLVHLWVDGVEHNTMDISAEVATSLTTTREMDFGAWNNQGRFNGRITDFRVYNRLVPDAIIRQMWDPRTRWDLDVETRRISYFDVALDGSPEITPPVGSAALTGVEPILDSGLFPGTMIRGS